MRAPKFWRTDNALSRFLEPFGHIVGVITTRRMNKAKPLRVDVPVIFTLLKVGESPEATP